MNPNKNYSPLAWEEIHAAVRNANENARNALARQLNELRNTVNADNPGNAGYLVALDQVAEAMGIKREEKVTYSA